MSLIFHERINELSPGRRDRGRANLICKSAYHVWVSFSALSATIAFDAAALRADHKK